MAVGKNGVGGRTQNVFPTKDGGVEQQSRRTFHNTQKIEDILLYIL